MNLSDFTSLLQTYKKNTWLSLSLLWALLSGGARWNFRVLSCKIVYHNYTTTYWYIYNYHN